MAILPRAQADFAAAKTGDTQGFERYPMRMSTHRASGPLHQRNNAEAAWKADTQRDEAPSAPERPEAWYPRLSMAD